MNRPAATTGQDTSEQPLTGQCRLGERGERAGPAAATTQAINRSEAVMSLREEAPAEVEGCPRPLEGPLQPTTHACVRRYHLSSQLPDQLPVAGPAAARNSGRAHLAGSAVAVGDAVAFTVAIAISRAAAAGAGGAGSGRHRGSKPGQHQLAALMFSAVRRRLPA